MRKNRIAVAAFFLINGIMYASWAARLPELESQYGVNHTGLGGFLFIHAVGAVIAMPFTGWLTLRMGNSQLTRLGGLVYCILPTLLPFVEQPWLAGIVFFLMGIFVGMLDVSMNGQAVRVEQKYGRTIMSSFHALFSLGMAMGAGLSAGMASLKVNMQLHFLTVGAVCLLSALYAGRHLIPTERKQRNAQSSGPMFVLPVRALWLLGVIAFCGMTGEGAMADWSAIFMREVVGQTEAWGAIAVGAFGAAMTLGRFFGDGFVQRWGKGKVLSISSLLALLGLLFVLGVGGVWPSLIGFFAVGLGLANVVPITYATAGHSPGIEPSVGIAMVTTIGYSGFFVGPPIIGLLGDAWGLQVGMIFPLVLFCVMWLLVQRKSLTVEHDSPS